MNSFSNPEVTSYINQGLKKYGIELCLQDYVDLKVDFGSRIVTWNRTNLHKLLPEDKISTYLKENVFSFRNLSNKTFYHYLPKFEYLLKILSSKKIRLNNLNKYLASEDDPSEYRHFLETFGITLPRFEEQITSIKDDIFIWSLTGIPNSHDHWKKYADNGRGVAIEVELEIFSENNKIELIPVQYELPFLEDLQKGLLERFGLRLEIHGYVSFAKYFKERRFEWENEIRLCFDNGLWHVDKLLQGIYGEDPNRKECDHLFTIHTDHEIKEKYILLPLKSNYWNIRIKKIYSVSEENFQRCHLDLAKGKHKIPIERVAFNKKDSAILSI